MSKSATPLMQQWIDAGRVTLDGAIPLRRVRLAGGERVAIQPIFAPDERVVAGPAAVPFELISDSDETVCNMFDVIVMKSMYGKKVRGIERSTFIIDANGKIVKEWRGVKVPGHVDEVLEFVQNLG